MLHTFKPGSKHPSVSLTYDGNGLRIEGDSSLRSDLTLLPIAKIHLTNVTFDPTSASLNIHAVIPQKPAFPESPLDLHHFRYKVDNDVSEAANAFAQAVRIHIYAGLKPQKRLKILINKFGGQGKAPKIFQDKVKPVLESAGCTLDVQFTEYHGHAKVIAKELDTNEYDTIVTVSGDGVIHEVINGFLERSDALEAIKKVPLGVIPAGTGNALSVCMLGEVLGFDPTYTALQLIKGRTMAFDLCSVTFEDKRYFSFLSHNYGITSYADLATENMRWMGDTRTIIGLLQQIFKGETYGMEAAIQIEECNKETIKNNYLDICTNAKEMPSASTTRIEDTIPPLSEPVPEDWTVINGDVSVFLTSKAPWLARGMLSHPCALPNDGYLDLMLIRGKHSIFKQLGIFTKVETGHHIDSDAIEYYKIKAFRLKPVVKPGKSAYIAIDGEHAPVKPFQVQVHPGIGSVLSLYPSYANTRSWRPAKAPAARSAGSFDRLQKTFGYVMSLLRGYVGRLANFFRKLASCGRPRV